MTAQSTKEDIGKLVSRLRMKFFDMPLSIGSVYYSTDNYFGDRDNTYVTPAKQTFVFQTYRNITHHSTPDQFAVVYLGWPDRGEEKQRDSSYPYRGVHSYLAHHPDHGWIYGREAIGGWEFNHTPQWAWVQEEYKEQFGAVEVDPEFITRIAHGASFSEAVLGVGEVKKRD